MAISEATQMLPVSAGRLIFRPQEDCVLIYNAETDQLYTMQPLGVKILKLCDGTRSAHQIATETFADEPESVPDPEAIVSRFLEELQRRQLLTSLAGGS
jgi:hypothetical protein